MLPVKSSSDNQDACNKKRRECWDMRTIEQRKEQNKKLREWPTHSNKLWNKYLDTLTNNILHYLHHTADNSHINLAKSAENYALIHLQSILCFQGHSLEEFLPMPLLSNLSEELDRLIHEELSYDTYSCSIF
ncbi:7775_t:CDS:2 [Gigaspora margarita]|uniref:7775_t:CDS:1 n=1 Tax=Gigaspora margarita TaxID=4874 RepID=A0ABN7UK62_GIGMA|nr:7775_t:CDS:2 [Gigaspora margarita]